MIMPKILVVAGSAFFLELAKGFLKQSAVSVFTSRSGAEAVEMARQHRPTLIYLDFNSDDVEGNSCCRILKSDPLLGRIPIIMIIAAAGEQNRHVYLQTGCDALLTKPVTRKDFLSAGRSFLERIERRELRLPCRATVLFRVDGTAFYGTIEDLSAHGMYIGFAGGMTNGAELQVSFILPGSAEVLEMAALVAWVNCGSRKKKPELPSGFGIEFQQVSESQAETLRLFLDYSLLRHPQVGDEEPVKEDLSAGPYGHS